MKLRLLLLFLLSPLGLLAQIPVTPPGGGGGGSIITCSTSGGIIYWNGAAYVCSAAGSPGQVLTWPASGSVPVFATAGGGTLFSTATVAATVTTAASPQFFAVNGVSGGTGGEGNIISVIGGSGCTAHNAYAVTSNTNGTGILTITLRNAGSPTTLQITVGSGVAAGTFSDTTHNVAIVAGTTVSWTATMGGTLQTSAPITGIGFQCS